MTKEWCEWPGGVVTHECGAISRGKKSHPIRYRCSKCKSRFLLRGYPDDDNTCWLYYLPKHKKRKK